VKEFFSEGIEYVKGLKEDNLNGEGKAVK